MATMAGETRCSSGNWRAWRGKPPSLISRTMTERLLVMAAEWARVRPVSSIQRLSISWLTNMCRCRGRERERVCVCVCVCVCERERERECE